MKRFRTLVIEIVFACLRVFPFGSRTGLVRIGTPGRGSPVLLTGNFLLTVERVKRAFEGLDAYLLVANSRGVNVWCAATGGHLTHHDVISVLKTSGIDQLVDHHQVILPQLAATGIDGKAIFQKTGWTVIWGPVRAADVPEFLEDGLDKSQKMRTVDFPWLARIEMAVAWAFPMSILALVASIFWPASLLPLLGIVWGLSFLIFFTFPLYQGLLGPRAKPRVGWIFFDFGRYGLPLLFWAAFLAALIAYAAAKGSFSWEWMLRWSLASLVVVLLLSLDLTGSTPVYKSGLHQDRLLRISLDLDRCRGAGFCEKVCPTDVLDVDPVRRLASLSRMEQCVQCGACIVQCPFDALYFTSPDGKVLSPEKVRRFKLNLMGKRLVKVSGADRNPE